jgi:hypothetical protein
MSAQDPAGSAKHERLQIEGVKGIHCVHSKSNLSSFPDKPKLCQPELSHQAEIEKAVKVS